MMMEYVEGTNLRDLLKIRTRIDAAAALPMMIGLCAGLQYSFEHWVTHRDIKGTNILIANTGVAKLRGLRAGDHRRGQFEVRLAQPANRRLLRARTDLQQPQGDPQSDIYFLGCVFYQMLTGQLAMAESGIERPLAEDAQTQLRCHQTVERSATTPHPDLTRIIEKMMKVDLKSRYQLMSEVHNELVEFQTAAARSLGRQCAPQRTRRRSRMSSTSIRSFRIEIPSRSQSPRSGRCRNRKPRGEAASEAEPDHLDFEIKAIQQKHILCVETQSEIQDAFRKSLSKLGYRVILVSDAERAAERYRETTPEAVIFDVDGFGDEGLNAFVDMHDKAHEDEHDLAAVVLLGPKQAKLKERLPADDRLIVFVKPVKMKGYPRGDRPARPRRLIADQREPDHEVRADSRRLVAIRPLDPKCRWAYPASKPPTWIPSGFDSRPGRFKLVA